MSVVVFWVVMPYGLIGGYQRFGGTYRLHLQGEDRNRHGLRIFENEVMWRTFGPKIQEATVGWKKLRSGIFNDL
jgi:hypothetical protein